jgi:hypothetical protein
MGRELKRLYYIAGMAPTEAEKADAEELGISMLRNALGGNDTLDGLEVADEVAGLVPRGYWKMRGCKLIGKLALEAFAKAKEQVESREKAKAVKPAADGRK